MINLANDLDVRCAQACKLEILVNDRPMYMIPNHNRAWLLPPEFSSDRAWSFLLEDEIERRGLQDAYLLALAEDGSVARFHQCPSGDCCPRSHIGIDDVWTLMRTSPEERARAFLAAVQAKGVA